MIGFECPWCDHEVSLTTQALAEQAVVCAQCSTRIDLSVGPAGQLPAIDPGLPLAA